MLICNDHQCDQFCALLAPGANAPLPLSTTPGCYQVCSIWFWRHVRKHWNLAGPCTRWSEHEVKFVSTYGHTLASSTNGSNHGARFFYRLRGPILSLLKSHFTTCVHPCHFSLTYMSYLISVVPHTTTSLFLFPIVYHISSSDRGMQLTDTSLTLSTPPLYHQLCTQVTAYCMLGYFCWGKFFTLFFTN